MPEPCDHADVRSKLNRLLCFLALALPPSAQLEPGIEVATVKPSRPDEGFSLGVGRGGANVFTTTATSVRTLIQFANGVHPRQIYGPAWIDSEHYDITAKSDQAGSPGIPQMRVMMQKVLADRDSDGRVHKLVLVKATRKQ